MIDDHPSTILGVKTAVNQANDMEFYNGYATLPEFYENVYGPSRKAVIYPVDVVLLDLRLADSSNPYDNTIALIKLGFKVLIYSSLESPFRFRSVLGAGAHGLFEKADPWTNYYPPFDSWPLGIPSPTPNGHPSSTATISY